MDAEKLKRLHEEVIRHWEENLEKVRKGRILDMEIDSVDCAFCQVFMRDDCHGCPIRRATGQMNCHGTPYPGVEAVLRLFRAIPPLLLSVPKSGREWRPGGAGFNATEAVLHYVTAMLGFLKDLEIESKHPGIVHLLNQADLFQIGQDPYIWSYATTGVLTDPDTEIAFVSDDGEGCETRYDFTVDALNKGRYKDGVLTAETNDGQGPVEIRFYKISVCL